MNKTIKIHGSDDDGDYTEDVEFPAKWEVCGRCYGEGKHDPESFSQGFSSEDFAEDPEFAESYFAGHYDIPCTECHGRTTVLVIDETNMDEELKKKYEIYLENLADAASYRSERNAERRMGA